MSESGTKYLGTVGPYTLYRLTDRDAEDSPFYYTDEHSDVMEEFRTYPQLVNAAQEQYKADQVEALQDEISGLYTSCDDIPTLTRVLAALQAAVEAR